MTPRKASVGQLQQKWLQEGDKVWRLAGRQKDGQLQQKRLQEGGLLQCRINVTPGAGSHPSCRRS